jgi:ATP/maltotriose-dependent transcriptional regulator MalT
MIQARTSGSTIGGMLEGVDRWSSDHLVGRENERERLDQALRDAVAGRVRILLVSGESGVGKSRLVSTFATDALLSGARVLAGSCLDVGEGVLPYAPFVEALRGLIAELPSAAVDELVGEGRSDLARLIPEVATTSATNTASAAPAGQLFELILRVLTRLATDQPVVLVIEDVHWADRSTMHLVAFLERNLRAAVLLLLTVRADELHRGHPIRGRLAELDRRGRLSRLDLAPLDRRATAELITALLRRPPPPRLVGQVYERSEGNPFHIEMLVAAEAEAGLHRRRLPDRLRDALISQIDGLQPVTQRVLRVAAVIGRQVDSGLLPELASITGYRPEQITGALQEAVSRHVFVAAATGDAYLFRHALLQEAVYDDMLPDERSRIHGAVARILEARFDTSQPGAAALAELAHHWFAAQDQPRALVASVNAARAAVQNFAPAEAVVQFDRALMLWDQVPDVAAVTGMQRSDIFVASAKAADLAGEPVLAARHLKTAVALLDRAAQPELVADLLLQLSWFVYFGVGDQHEGDTYVREAAGLVPAQTPTSVRATLLSALAYLALRRGDYGEVVRLSGEALDVAQRVGDDQLRRAAQARIAQGLVFLGQVDKGVAYALAAVEPEPPLEAYRAVHVYINATDALGLAGRVDDVVRIGRDGVRLGLRQGARSGNVPFILGNIAETLIDAGRWAEADEYVTEALDMDPGITSERVVRHWHARLLFERGQVDLAHREWEDLLRLGVEDAPWHSGVTEGLAACLLFEGNLAAARRVVDDGIRWVQDHIRYGSSVVLVGLAVEVAAADRGLAQSSARTQRLLDRLDAQMRAHSGVAPLIAARVASARATAARVLGGDELARWSDAVERWEALSMLPGLAAAYVGRARARLDVGDRAGAAEDLRRARGLTDQIGASLRRDEIDSLASRAGLRLGERAATRDDDLLTRREREVLGLLVAGCTNRQIAERLFIAEKTASVHVSNILAKLGVPNRGQAVAAAQGRGLV